MDAIVVTQDQERNERWYRHVNVRAGSQWSCGAWMVPLDDAPIPETKECAECAAIVPVHAVVPVERLVGDDFIEALRRVLSEADGTVEPWAEHHYRAEAEQARERIVKWLVDGE